MSIILNIIFILRVILTAIITHLPEIIIFVIFYIKAVRRIPEFFTKKQYYLVAGIIIVEAIISWKLALLSGIFLIIDNAREL